MDEHAPRGPDVITHPPLLYLGPLVAGSVLDRMVPLPALIARTGRSSHNWGTIGRAEEEGAG